MKPTFFSRREIKRNRSEGETSFENQIKDLRLPRIVTENRFNSVKYIQELTLNKEFNPLM